MSAPDEPVPEPIAPSTEGTGEISMLAPEEALKVAAEIRAVAEKRGEDSEVVELVDLPPSPSGPTDFAPPGAPVKPHFEDEVLGPDDLRDAWPLLDSSTSAATACASCRARTPRTSSSR